MTRSNRAVLSSFWTAFCGLLLTALLWIGSATLQSRTPLSGNPAELYSTETRDDLQLTFTNAIEEAKDSVLLFIYSFEDRRVIQTLRNKAEEGVDVKVICDANASKGIHKKLGQKVKIFPRDGKGLMHQKILVIDNQKVWIGSANLTPSSLKMHGNLVTGFNSPELAAMIRKKADYMTTVGLVKSMPVSEFSIGDQKVEMWFFPDNPHGVEKIRKLIQTAQKSIRVAMFTWTRFDFAKDISDAKQRGVSVEVAIDRNSSNSASSGIVKDLFESGIPVRTSTGNGLLHHKLMIVDGKTLVNGSANWTLSAFTKNDDCFVVIHDLNQKQQNLLNKMWNTILNESEPFSKSIVPK